MVHRFDAFCFGNLFVSEIFAELCVCRECIVVCFVRKKKTEFLRIKNICVLWFNKLSLVYYSSKFGICDRILFKPNDWFLLCCHYIILC